MYPYNQYYLKVYTHMYKYTHIHTSNFTGMQPEENTELHAQDSHTLTGILAWVSILVSNFLTTASLDLYFSSDYHGRGEHGHSGDTNNRDLLNPRLSLVLVMAQD